MLKFFDLLITAVFDDPLKFFQGSIIFLGFLTVLILTIKSLLFMP